MLVFLLQTVKSANFGHSITELTSKNWEKQIKKRSNTTVYLVMFHGQHCPACQMAYPAFEEAGDEAAGMIKFGHVDTNKEYNIASQFNIRGIPHFIIFHPKGEKVYNGDRSARSFLNTASRFIPNIAEDVDETWLPSNETKSVILFSDKTKAPPIWAGISCAFQGNKDGIRIGYSSNQEIRSKFNVTAVPWILMINNETSYVYSGKNSYSLIRKTIIDFFAGKIKRPQPKTPVPVSILKMESIEEFNNACKGHGNFCVLLGEKSDAQYQTIARKYRNDPFKFYECDEKCPFEFSKGAIHIFHHRRDAAIKVQTLVDLPTNLDRVIDGGARFTPIDLSKDL